MIKKLFGWFMANALLPILAPVIFMCTVYWFEDGSFPFLIVFIELVRNGFYVFSALALIFSLTEDYSDLRMSGIGPFYGALLMLIVILTLYMFFLIQTKDSLYVSNHGLQFGLVWLFTALVAFYAKFKLIKYKRLSGLL